MVFHFQNSPLWNTNFNQVYKIHYACVVCQLVSQTKEYCQCICNTIWSFHCSLVFEENLFFLILSWYCYPKLVISCLQNLSSDAWYCQKSILTSILHHFSLCIFQERSVLLNLLSYILFNVTIIDLCIDVHIERHEPITFVRTFWWNAFNPINSIKGIFNAFRHERVHSECLKNLARIRPCSVMCWTCGIYDWSELGKIGKIFLYFG